MASDFWPSKQLVFQLFPDRLTVCSNSYGPEEETNKKKVDKDIGNKCNKRPSMTRHILCQYKMQAEPAPQMCRFKFKRSKVKEIKLQM